MPARRPTRPKYRIATPRLQAAQSKCLVQETTTKQHHTHKTRTNESTHARMHARAYAIVRQHTAKPCNTLLPLHTKNLSHMIHTKKSYHIPSFPTIKIRNKGTRPTHSTQVGASQHTFGNKHTVKRLLPFSAAAVHYYGGS